MPNPLYQGEQLNPPLTTSWFNLICVTAAEADEALTYEYGVWGADCKKGTPDDDDNDIG